jgi:hypothetical protein
MSIILVLQKDSMAIYKTLVDSYYLKIFALNLEVILVDR